MAFHRWILKHAHRLGGKTVAISGATGGLGQELCHYLASLGAKLILLDRNMEKSHALREKLLATHPRAQISHIRVDMSDLDSVKDAADELKQQPLHMLILNAGAYSIPRYQTEAGYDNVFTINCIAPYYLVRELLPHLSDCGGRVIAVGSIAHRYSKIHPQDLDFSTFVKASLVYGNAKRHLMFALHELMTTSHVPLAITHPGITFTGITSHYPKWLFALIKHPMKVIFMPPRKAALSILIGCFEDTPYGTWFGPRLFDIWGKPRKSRLRAAKEEERKIIFSRLEQIYEKIKSELSIKVQHF